MLRKHLLAIALIGSIAVFSGCSKDVHTDLETQPIYNTESSIVESENIIEDDTVATTPEDTIPNQSSDVQPESTTPSVDEEFSREEPVEEEVSPPTQEETQPDETDTSEPTDNVIEEPDVPEETEPTVPKITFDVVDEIVYATSPVNVRTGPGTEFDRIGQLNMSDSVKRIGVGSNGWSKVIYNNTEAYISSNYLTLNKPVIEEPKDVKYLKPSGPYAIPDYSIYNESEADIVRTVLEKIKENKDNLDLHEENIDFAQEITYQSYCKVSSFFYVYYGQKQAVDEVFDFVRSSGVDENGNRLCYLKIRYDDIRRYEKDLADVKYKVDTILCSLEDGSEEYILKQISEYLRKHITYTNGKSSLQDALLSGQSVCNGYALAFNMLANRAGIRSDLCIGTSSNGEYHAWNRVTLSDGSQYFYDITWYDSSNGPDNRYIHSKSNFHGSYLINDYSGC